MPFFHDYLARFCPPVFLSFFPSVGRFPLSGGTCLWRILYTKVSCTWYLVARTRIVYSQVFVTSKYLVPFGIPGTGAEFLRVYTLKVNTAAVSTQYACAKLLFPTAGPNCLPSLQINFAHLHPDSAWRLDNSRGPDLSPAN